MTAQSWQKHHQKKYRYSLSIFLLLNFISALFSLTSPVFPNASATIPSLVITLLLSATLIAGHWRFPQYKINIPAVSFIFGMLWAWFITEKMLMFPQLSFNFLLIVLLIIIFMGAISFTSNVLAFILYASPIFITCQYFAQGEQWLRMSYYFVLALIGIALQNIIQRHSETFTQGLVDRLMSERNTLNNLSMLDPLTGLYNRRGLEYQLATIPAVNDSDHHVLLLDIDYFKSYNDNYGHMMGDQALIHVSAAIRDAVRSRDIVVRYGGEEFMVLLTNRTAEAAWLTAGHIRQKVYDLKIPHMFNDSVATHVTISIGMTPLTNADLNSAIKRADAALYKAKKQGRNIILVN